jgi:hypothetical protein
VLEDSVVVEAARFETERARLAVLNDKAAVEIPIELLTVF